MKIPVDVSSIYEGERIPEERAHADFGREVGVELLRVADEGEVEDGKVTLVGRDIQDVEAGENLPLGIFIKVAGKNLEEDVEGVFERRLHEFLNYIQGFVHNGSRDTMWCRVSKEAKEAGLKFEHIGKALIDLYKKEYRVIDKMEISFFTDDAEVKKLLDFAREIFAKRDEKIRKIKDEDVDVFYGCMLCQNHAPNHACIISPSRTSNCGAISWLEARAYSKIDPHGYIFEVPKGEVLDKIKGEYSGVDEKIREKSSGVTERLYMHSMFDHPHTSCGCAEAIAFYIPEVDGIGIVDAKFKGKTPFGMDFATLIKQIGVGTPTPGFLGISYAYMKSSRFLQGDGGWSRVVWMPSHLKQELLDYIPEEFKDRIATEKEAPDLESLRKFLGERGEKKEAQEKSGAEVQIPYNTGKKVRVIFENANIRFGKIIFTTIKD